MSTTEQAQRLSREEIISLVLKRDGASCYHPDCRKKFQEIGGKVDREDVTIDHWYPQARGGTWDLDNLRLMHKSCNARKGDLIPLSDTELPLKSRRSNHAERRAARSARVDVCTRCESGRLVQAGERCMVCGSGPQPGSFPRHAQKKPRDCSHGWVDPRDHCWMCVIGHVARKPAMEVLITGPA